MVEESVWDQDFDKLNQEKLEMIKRKMNLKEEDLKIEKGIVYLTNCRKNLCSYLKIGNLDEKELVKEINLKINLFIAEYIKFNKNIFDGCLTTTKEEQRILSTVDFKTGNRIICSHKEQIRKEQIRMIKDLLVLFFHFDYRENISEKEFLEKTVLFNLKLNKEETKLFYKRLEETDYL